ncbi:MAG: hypothetical protein K2W94_02630 [Alphaproteobacteria bacterium]|nr:hypothetical protein [Alphaproteobacteria bacterium]
MSQENKKKIVAFDTGFLSNAIKGKIDIDAEFPTDTCSRTIQDTVIDELFFNKEPTDGWYEADRKNWLNFYQKHDFWTMESQHIILLKEYLYGHVLLERCDLFEEQIKLYFEDIHPEQKAREHQHLILRKKNQEAKKETFKKCFSSSNDRTFSISRFDKELFRFIKENEKFETPIIDEYLSQLIKRDPLQIIIRGNNLSLKITRANKISFKYFKTFSDLKNEYPTLYNIRLYDFFIDSSKKLTGTPGKDSFHISLNGVKNSIEITENLLPDFKISLPALHYVDAFVTGDKGQAQLIKGLFPDYWDKKDIRFYKTVKENGVDVYKDCSHEI